MKAPWDALLPELRARVRFDVEAIVAGKAVGVPMSPREVEQIQEAYRRRFGKRCEICGKQIRAHGMGAHMRSHADSWAQRPADNMD